MIVCACIDSTLHFIKTKNGVQICCPIMLDSKVAVLKCNSNYCMCITVYGSIYLWKYNLFENSPKNSTIAFGSSSMDLGFTSSTETFLNQNELNESNLVTLINRQSCFAILKGILTI